MTPADPAPTDWFAAVMSAQQVRHHSVRGALVTVLRRLATQGVQFVTLVLLARLLTPEETGLVAAVAALSGFAALVAELQLSTLTVMLPRFDEHQCSTLFWLRIALSGLAAAILIAVAPWAGAFYSDARVPAVLQVLALGVPLTALGSQHGALLRRNLRIDVGAQVAVASTLAVAAVSVIGALAGLSYWALVAGSLAGSTVSTTLLWVRCDWRPLPPRPGGVLAGLLRQGGQLSTFNVLGYIAGYLSHVLIARNWGVAATGLYARGASLNGMLLSALWEPLDAVAGPALAQLRSDPERMMRYYYRCSTLLVMACLPVMFLGLALPLEFVRLVLGPQWEASADILRWLAAGALFSVVSHTSGWVFFSVGDPGAVMRWGLIGWPAMIAATLVGNEFGPSAIAAALSLTSGLMMLPCLRAAFRGTPLRIAVLLRAIAPTLTAGLLAAVPATLLLAQIPAERGVVRLVAGMAVFTLAYCGLLVTVCGQLPLLRELLGALRRRTTTSHD